MSFHPYLAFAGNARDAFTRYQQIFGGQLDVLTMADMPADAPPVPDEQKHLVMHAALTTDLGDLLMGADSPPGAFDGHWSGGCTNVTVDSTARAKEVFDALAEGGSVQMPLGETFFSPAFGMCTDRFGVPWMVNTPPPEG